MSFPVWWYRASTMYSGMISAFAGSIWITIIVTMKVRAAREAELRERDRGEEREHHREHDDDA